MKKYTLAVLFACLSLLPLDAAACACCAERGEYQISTTRPGETEMATLNEIKFDEAADLFMTQAGFEGLKGLKSIEKDYDANDWTESGFLGLTNSFAARTWKFNFKTKTGKTGTLALPLPTQMVSFRADLHDAPENTEVSLYKEWRFKGTVQTGTGFFSASILRPTTYFLVLQGRGNNCSGASDFTHWRLEITGKNADYALFGKLKR